jgi:pilus assembly protein CpaB
MSRRKILLPLAAIIAAVGTLMVFLYVQGADKRADDRYEAVEVLQAVKQIQPGETFDDAAKASKFQMRAVSRDQVLDGTQTDLGSLSGTIATQTIYPGEQITDNKWGAVAEAAQTLQIPKGMMAISVNLTDPGRVSGFVNPGSEVAVFMTGDRESGGTFARMLLNRVLVLGIGDTSTTTSTTKSADGAETVEQIPRTLMTLAVSQRDAQRVLYAVSNGELAVGLLTDDTDMTRSEFTTDQNLFQ